MQHLVEYFECLEKLLLCLISQSFAMRPHQGHEAPLKIKLFLMFGRVCARTFTLRFILFSIISESVSVVHVTGHLELLLTVVIFTWSWCFLFRLAMSAAIYYYGGKHMLFCSGAVTLKLAAKPKPSSSTMSQ